ncbi:MAG: nitroreductase [Deltaproteobacteria bacterium]|nr:nitroreductase [Deltaproteobacteria bacterium]
MELRQAVQERRSIRRFKPDPVPETLVREILDAARWSPSWGNTQPWEFYVITGEPLQKFQAANGAAFDEKGQPQPDIKMPDSWTEELKKRYMAIGKSALDSLGLARDDAAGRNDHGRNMFRLFNAPCLIVACIDKRSTSVEYALLDVGLISQTICLLAHDRGLGTCLLACAVRFPAVLKSLLPDGDDKLLAIGIILGYPDGDAPINRFARERATLDEIVTWVK